MVMKAEDAWRIGDPGTEWCGRCSRTPGLEEKQCGYSRPVVEKFTAVSQEPQEKCHCLRHDGRKVANRQPRREPQGRQADLFGG